MSRLKRRLVLSLAALSPGVLVVSMHEFALSMAFMLLGLFGAIGFATAAFAFFPSSVGSNETSYTPNPAYPSLLLAHAHLDLRLMAPDPLVIRAELKARLDHGVQEPRTDRFEGELTAVLVQIMARWQEKDPLNLGDDQAREIWLVERLLRATPAEAGALAGYFAAPNAMLTMRDSLAASGRA